MPSLVQWRICRILVLLLVITSFVTQSLPLSGQREAAKEEGDNENDNKAYPPDSLESAPPTPTTEFPVELRTNPPTPTMLFPPSLQTAPPTKTGATYHPTMEPTSSTMVEPTSPTMDPTMNTWEKVTSTTKAVRTEWDNTDTIVVTVLLTFFLIVTFIYCVCCTPNKESLMTADHGAGGRGGDSKGITYTNVRSSDYHYSPLSTPRGSGSDGRVEVINPQAESAPLLSPPRSRAQGRRGQGGEDIPLRAARGPQPRPPDLGYQTADDTADEGGDLNI